MSRFKKASIQFKGYCSSPFCHWQDLADEHAIVLGAATANRRESTHHSFMKDAEPDTACSVDR
jgi:hypothetical protein